MKKFVYPAVFYYSDASKLYCAAIKDLSIYMAGETVEEAHKNAAEVLEAYISTCITYGDEIPQATTFEETVEKYPKNLVMLVECTVN